MIGIIGAMKIEVEALQSAMEDVRAEQVGNLTFFAGKLEGKDAVVVKCGIGKVNAALCAQTLILCYHPDILINTGVAGTLTDKLSVGDVAVSQGAVQHDLDTTALGDPAGLVPEANRVVLPTDEELAQKALGCVRAEGLNACLGVIASGDVFVSSPEKKAEIVRTFGAVACEMEGAAIAHAAFLSGVRVLILRAISDSANGDSPVDFPAFCRKAAAHSTRITRALVRTL